MNALGATVVSILPFDIKEAKYGIYPTHYEVPSPKNDEEFGLCYIPNDCYGLIYQLDGKQIQVPVPPWDVARAIVEDFRRAQLAATPFASAGLFWLPGTYEREEVILKHQKELARVRKEQDEWYKLLVTMADDDYQKTKQRRAVSDLQRFAARSLGLERDWLSVVAEHLKFCPMCGTELRKNVAKCFSCGFIVDQALHDSLMKASIEPIKASASSEKK